MTPVAPSLGAILADWHWRPDVPLVLLALGAAYVAGWRRIRRRGYRHLASRWRLAAYLAALGAIGVALLSPLASLAHVLFAAHMVQHQLLIMVAAPLLLLGNPFPLTLWALPPGVRRVLGASFARGGRLRGALRLLTWMPVAGGLYTANLWGWHHPRAYEAALASPVVHDFEHLLFFGTAVLFWWPVVNAAPRLHRLVGGLSYGLRIAYLVLATGQNTLLGALLGLAERVLYASYATAPRLFGWTVLEDQALGGGIMWSGGHMYLIAILVLVNRALDSEGHPERAGRAIGARHAPPARLSGRRDARDTARR